MELGILHHMLQRARDDLQSAVFKSVLEQTLLAEDLGFGTTWFTEHHFSNYGICASPLMLASYVAARARRIRVGTGVLVLPLHNPLRLVQEVLLADHLSEGRLTLGVGTGFQVSEFRAYGMHIGEASARFLECLEILDMGLTSGRVSYRGMYHKIVETPIVLQPIQKPRPPIFVAGLAGQRDVQCKVLALGCTPFVHAAAHPTRVVVEMKEKWREAHGDTTCSTSGMPFAYQRFVCVTNSKNEARDFAEGIRYMTRLSASLRHDYAMLDGAHLRDMPLRNEVDVETVMQNSIIGDAETCSERLQREITALRPSHLSCFFQVAGLEHRRTVKSIEAFGTRVVPALRKLLCVEEQLQPSTLPIEETSVLGQAAH